MLEPYDGRDEYWASAPVVTPIGSSNATAIHNFILHFGAPQLLLGTHEAPGRPVWIDTVRTEPWNITRRRRESVPLRGRALSPPKSGDGAPKRGLRLR